MSPEFPDVETGPDVAGIAIDNEDEHIPADTFPLTAWTFGMHPTVIPP